MPLLSLFFRFPWLFTGICLSSASQTRKIDRTLLNFPLDCLNFGSCGIQLRFDLQSKRLLCGNAQYQQCSMKSKDLADVILHLLDMKHVFCACLYSPGKC